MLPCALVNITTDFNVFYFISLCYNMFEARLFQLHLENDIFGTPSPFVVFRVVDVENDPFTFPPID